MRKQGKLTKGEIVLLAITAAFIALALVIHFSDRARQPQDGYSIRTWLPEEASDRPAPIDINTADEETLQRLPGIGQALAERIAADRTANGPYATVDDLTRVSGIGEKTVEELRPYATAEVPGEEAARENSGG